ncbi:MAG: bifunctional hydroxymethylpyrimidine kinase/phosphomethylpyrimidine kinase [Magnetococcales bacterium]|nr:bifunctional hydroxymethylpyrimidine kinase/phosphomethylpyrimidine kinase [Magnetococcales bacterium]
MASPPPTSTETAPPPQGRVLTVAGSDPSAGAGLQMDLKMIAAMGGIGLCAVTAITVQDTERVHRVEPLDPELVTAQMLATLEDIGADVIKLGMLANGGIVSAVADVLGRYPEIPVVADPVLAGTGGGQLLDGDGRRRFMQELLPRITLLTPNLPEAQQLTRRTVSCEAEMEQAAHILTKPGGAKAVLITGGHLPGERITDLLFDGDTFYRRTQKRIPSNKGFHGTGCALASSIASALALGHPLSQAVALAQRKLQQALHNALPLGRGQRILSGR